jgi:hypothetical protein
MSSLAALDTDLYSNAGGLNNPKPFKTSLKSHHAPAFCRLLIHALAAAAAALQH